MPGTSQGTSYPELARTYPSCVPGESGVSGSSATDIQPSTVVSDEEFAAAATRARASVERLEKINTDSEQRGRTWSLPVAPEAQSSTPLWSGRMQWQRQVRECLNTNCGTELCKQHQIDPERVFAVAVSMAGVADHRTGRRVTASRTVLAERAGVSLTVLKRARRVLSSLGMAKEMVRGRFLRTIEQWAAEAHHGRPQIKATSVWALLSPSTVVRRFGAAIRKVATAAVKATQTDSTSTEIYEETSYPQIISDGPQSLALAFSSCSSVRKNKTNARASAHEARRNSKTNRKPRSISLQRAAADLVDHAPALRPEGHIGSVCDALSTYSIDTTRWTGRDIARTLGDDTKARGWVWPTVGSLDNPVKFLRWRLARIDWSGPSPSERAIAAKIRRDEERHVAAQVAAERDKNIASSSTRTLAMTVINATLAAKASKRKKLASISL